MSEGTRESGTVEKFDARRGFGFITREDDKPNIFVHYTNINGEGYKELKAEERVTFVVGDTDKGPTALEVERETEVESV